MILLILYLVLAIGVSFLCSILEAVFLSLTPSYVSAQITKGTRSGRLMNRLKRNVDRPIAAILSLNTIAHTVGAVGVGVQAQVVFENLSVSVVSGVLTVLILVLSEIIPKTLGANFWRPLAVPSTHVVYFLTFLMWPMVVLSQALSKLLTTKERSLTISREEIFAMADLGHREGVIDKQDAEALRNILRFKNVRVKDILTPRVVVITIEARQTIREVMEQPDKLTFSRYPVTREGRISGYVMKNDILTAAANDEWDKPVSELLRKVLFVPETMPLKRAFTIFLKSREHMVAVVDEFGSFSGVLSLEDVMESLIGHEIMDEVDEIENLREFARQERDSGSDPVKD